MLEGEEGVGIWGCRAVEVCMCVLEGVVEGEEGVGMWL